MLQYLKIDSLCLVNDLGLVLIVIVLEMICIGLTLAQSCQRAVFFGRTCRGRRAGHWDSFTTDDDIGVLLQAFRARCFKGRGNARGNTLTERVASAGKDKLTSTTLLSDQRGAVAFETTIVWVFMMIFLLLPLADLAVAGFQFISAWEALRNFGQYVQYNPPANVVTDWTSSTSALTQMSTQLDSRYPIKNIQLFCGVDDPPKLCSSTNTSTPTYYSYKTTVTFSPTLGWVFGCSPCSFTLSYSVPYQ